MSCTSFNIRAPQIIQESSQKYNLDIFYKLRFSKVLKSDKDIR